NRGPGADGSLGVSIVADGAYAAGAEGINYFGLDGAYSWDSWGGTSRSAPVAAGNMALIYQAYKQKHGEWPTYDVARALMMSGATHLNYDVLTQGAGAVNADRATDIAGGHGGFYALPSTWQPGDYRGTEYPGFANILGPGESDTQTFTLTNDSADPITVSLTDGWMRLVGSKTFDWTSSPIDEESPYNGLVAPDYLIPIDAEDIPADADLMVVRMNLPFEQFDINGNYSVDAGDPANVNSEWRLLVYNWTDVDGDGLLWDDVDGNGVVNHVDADRIKNADWALDLDWENSEIDQYEYMRFGYHRPSGTNYQMWVREPLERMADGLFIGLQHSRRNANQPTTDMTFEIAFYSYEDWDWLSLDEDEITIPAGGSAEFQGTLAVPEGTPYGGYEGAILVEDQTADAEHTTVIPVYVSVAATWDGVGGVEFGGVAADDPDALYSNGSVRGLYDWSWRAESGDWRFFFLDVTEQPAPGTKMIIRTEWGDEAPTDIDTIVLGPKVDGFTNPKSTELDPPIYEPDYYGPYTLDTIGKSPNKNLGDGIWRFDTATGGPEDWLTVPLNEGLHQVLLHNVLHSGKVSTVPFTTTLGTVTVNPSAVELTTDSNSGSFVITFTSGIELEGLTVEAFGLSAPQVYLGQTVTQSATQNPEDDPLNEKNGWKLFPFTLKHASSAEIWTENTSTNDLDMYVFHDANRDGNFAYPDEVIGASETATSEEYVQLLNPRDGDYLVGVFGWDVTGGGEYDLVIQPVQGNSLKVTGAPDTVLPGELVTLTVSYTDAMPDQPFKAVLPLLFNMGGESQPMGKALPAADEPETRTYYGALTLGPSVAPGAVVVPITIIRQ
ncbi:MAG: S8 family serine peptidase, partial [Chloroflexi bacterium]|nr:S8 family serine peptidase [Chloroflexota bacterium]